MTDLANSDFWAGAPSLFELATSVGESLSRSATTEDVAKHVRLLADGIPDSPDAFSEVDPYLRTALLTAVIQALRADEDEKRPELRIAIERVRQALRDMLDEHPVWRSGPKHAAVWLRSQGLPIKDLADVLDASDTTVRRWASADDETAPSGDKALRVMVVAKVVNHLRHAMTPTGAMQWLLRPHPALDDRRPVDELKDPEAYRLLVHLASGTRSFVAT